MQQVLAYDEVQISRVPDSKMDGAQPVVLENAAVFLERTIDLNPSDAGVQEIHMMKCRPAEYLIPSSF